MTEYRKKTSHKLGANRNEEAHTRRQRDRNFAQSRDIWEDRGERQTKQYPDEKYRRRWSAPGTKGDHGQ